MLIFCLGIIIIIDFNRSDFRYILFSDLEEKLSNSMSARTRLIATDGVFSMDGNVAPLDKICDLADK